MLNKIARFALTALFLALPGCAVQSTGPTLTGPPVNLSAEPIHHAKKIFLLFSVGLEMQQESKKEGLMTHWKSFADKLVSDVESTGVQATYKIDADYHFLLNNVAVPDGTTHVLALQEAKGTVYHPNSLQGTLVEIQWEGAVSQVKNNGKFEQISAFKYDYAPSQCFIGTVTKEYTDNCIKAHSDFLIANLKKIGVL